MSGKEKQHSDSCRYIRSILRFHEFNYIGKILDEDTRADLARLIVDHIVEKESVK